MAGRGCDDQLDVGCTDPACRHDQSAIWRLGEVFDCAFNLIRFTKIDRAKDRTINFPAGDYTIFTRQNPAYATPFASKDGKVSGGLRLDYPERFWESSRFLIIVRS